MPVCPGIHAKVIYLFKVFKVLIKLSWIFIEMFPSLNWFFMLPYHAFINFIFINVTRDFAGHTRQGLKCRVCKMNVHLDCQEKVTTRCQVKSRLLRRQKSTSEIETKMAAMNVAGRDDDEGKPKYWLRTHPIQW